MRTSKYLIKNVNKDNMFICIDCLKRVGGINQYFHKSSDLYRDALVICSDNVIRQTSSRLALEYTSEGYIIIDACALLFSPKLTIF